jgi:hypothetical protein
MWVRIPPGAPFTMAKEDDIKYAADQLSKMPKEEFDRMIQDLCQYMGV